MGHVKGNSSHHVVIKHLKHNTWFKIKREVLVMQVWHVRPPKWQRRHIWLSIPGLWLV